MHFALAHHSDLADEAGKRAHHIGAARKAEQENLVVLLVIVDEKDVAGLDARRQSDAGAAAGNAVENVSGADALMIVDDLRDAVVVRIERAQDAHKDGLA